MAQPGFEHLRRLAVPGMVALLGIVLSASAYARVHAQETLAGSQDLSDAGEELARAAADLHLIASEQVLAIQGLFESRSVTIGQFNRFTSVIGTPLESHLAYAPMVPSDELNEFLDQARLAQPSFSIYGNDVEPIDEYWPLLYSTANAGEGYRPGFDFGSDPAIRAAIERGIVTGRPVASRFVVVPGDDQVGDFVVIAVIRRNSLPDGIAVATLRLDELLEPRLYELLGDTATLQLVNVFNTRDATGEQTTTSWTGTVNLAGQLVGLRVELAEESVSIWSASLWLFVLGFAISLLTGWLILDRSRRRSMIQQLGTLEQTLADKDRFLASVSHELRTPLTAVVGALELLGRDRSVDQDVQDMLLEDARVSASELERLVDDYLTAARLTAGALTLKLGVVDLDVLVARILAGIERPARISMSVGELGLCTGDAIRIRQIIRNLIRNANRFAVSEIEVRAARTRDLTTVEIVNDGDPVPTGVIGKLFDPFVKGSNPGQPDTLGLGLFVSRDLAIRMGGALSYSYDRGKVRFSLSLPAADPVVAFPSAGDSPEGRVA
jgi:signal transduction histidine kinase